MSGRRSSRSATLSSPLTLLAAVEPAHHAITRAMATVQIGGAHYQALDRMSAEMHRLAAELGHAGRFTMPPPAR